MPATLQAHLETIDETARAIQEGESLFLAGSRQVLERLPRGNWIGGTIAYFMTETGGLMTEDRIFVTPAPAFALRSRVATYGADEIENIYADAPESGFTFVVMPAGTAVLTRFAEQAPACDGFLIRPVVGWVAGVRVDRLRCETPAVFNGLTGEAMEDRCCALHVALPAGRIADLAIVNIFEPGDGEVIHFDRTGFEVQDCEIGGRRVNLAGYVASHALKTEFPLVGDYAGTNINVSFQKVDAKTGVVDFYAPVFPGVDYRFARPITDYAEAFRSKIGATEREPAFACNCILNYLYAKLEGKTTGSITGPITFGEIAHQLLNQTMVQLTICDVD